MTREEEILNAATESCNKYNMPYGVPSFITGAKYADEHPIKSEDNVTLSFHICNVPCPEEVMAGANAKYEAYFVPIPKNLIPKELLEVITKNSNNKYISQVALLKDGLV